MFDSLNRALDFEIMYSLLPSSASFDFTFLHPKANIVHNVSIR